MQNKGRTARRWWRRYETENNVKTKPKKGRNRVTSPQDDQEIVQRMQNNPFEHASNIAREFYISEPTVAARLREDGIKCFTAANRTKLTEEHRLYRIAFCEEMLGHEDEWDKYIFTDEKTFATNLNTKVHVWRYA